MGVEAARLTPEHWPQIMRPHLLTGGVILGRETDAQISPDSFRDSTVLMRMTRTTALIDVVQTVITHTHADTYAATDKTQVQFIDKLLAEVAENGPDVLNDKGIIEAIEDTFDDIPRTDLMRGMAAFAEAEYDRTQGMYEHSIIRPATRLAAWLIAVETDNSLDT